MLNAYRTSTCPPTQADGRIRSYRNRFKKATAFIALGIMGHAWGCSSPQTCAPQPGYPAYPAYPTSYSGYGAPGATVPAGATLPAGAMPAGTVPAGAAMPAGVPMAGVTAPVYSQPIPGAGYPAAGVAMPPGYAQPMVGR